ncbi:hypothetical protein KCP76_25355 [Salmonella enterica subsp. enterica serovar Weltevreden]|nr:hypothetical protein KCP76_25355 [Salmonella enterica subsp. enterica serovar Weltevreden]
MLATLLIWNNSAVWAECAAMAQTMTLQEALAGDYRKKRSIFATSASTTFGCWKKWKSSVISRRWRC